MSKVIQLIMASHLLAPLIFALLIVRPNWALESPLESELDKDFYKITFNETAMYNHNKAKNIECDVEVKELYRYTDHNFNTPVFEQTIAKAGKQICGLEFELQAIKTLTIEVISFYSHKHKLTEPHRILPVDRVHQPGDRRERRVHLPGCDSKPAFRSHNQTLSERDQLQNDHPVWCNCEQLHRLPDHRG